MYYKVLSVLLPGTTAWFKMPLVETDLTMGLDGEGRDASGPITPLGHETGCSYIFIERAKMKKEGRKEGLQQV